jgi:hypothetical protein
MESLAMSAHPLQQYRLLLTSAAAAIASLFASAGLAEGEMVPIGLQAELLGKIAGYDRNFAARAPGRVAILLVANPSEPASTPVVLEMRRALSGLESVGGRPHDERVVVFSTVSALFETVRVEKAGIVYFGPGFGDQVESISASFVGQNVLTVSAFAGDVPRGIVLGFELVSSKPKLLVHLGQARKQGVDFRAEVLKLVRVYE